MIVVHCYVAVFVNTEFSSVYHPFILRIDTMFLLLLTVALGQRSVDPTLQDTSLVCPHEYVDNVRPIVRLDEGQSLYTEILKNQTHRYLYETYNVTVMNQSADYRKLIISLEPCKGVVYVLVRRTRPCWPNPYSCINLVTGERDPTKCEWTHFMSVIDGSRDGSPTFFEVPLTASRWFISVYAPETSSYSLTVLADTGALPRPGAQGMITGSQKGELKVQLDWKQAYFSPVGVSSVKRYWVYASMLLKEDNRTNTQVFLRSGKILNTVCGLHNNTDREYHIVDPSSCDDSATGGTGTCSVNITGGVLNTFRVYFTRFECSLLVSSVFHSFRVYFRRDDGEALRVQCYRGESAWFCAGLLRADHGDELAGQEQGRQRADHTRGGGPVRHGPGPGHRVLRLARENLQLV